MKRNQFKWQVGGILVMVGLSIFVFSCSTIDRVVLAPPMIEGAKYVGMDACTTCHEKAGKDFKHTSHARVALAGSKTREGQGCEQCHGPGSKHIDADGKGFIINPAKDPKICFSCHIEKNAEFSLPYHHPLKEGKINCIDCHNPHGQNIKLASKKTVGRVNENCAQCHREQTRPHVFEHEALREGCVTCHNVHGSINPKMLVQRDVNLCIKCHAQALSTTKNLLIANDNHSGNLSRGTCFSAGCHTAVHGSNVNPHLRY